MHHSEIRAFLLASTSINHSGISMSSRRHDLLLQFKGLAVASSISNFYSFIGFHFRILISTFLLLEEEGRFKGYRPVLRAPTLRHTLRFSCAGFKWEERFKGGTHSSVLMRDNRGSGYFFSSRDPLLLDISISSDFYTIFHRLSWFFFWECQRSRFLDLSSLFSSPIGYGHVDKMSGLRLSP